MENTVGSVLDKIVRASPCIERVEVTRRTVLDSCDLSEYDIRILTKVGLDVTNRPCYSFLDDYVEYVVGSERSCVSSYMDVVESLFLTESEKVLLAKRSLYRFLSFLEPNGRYKRSILLDVLRKLNRVYFLGGEDVVFQVSFLSTFAAPLVAIGLLGLVVVGVRMHDFAHSLK